MTRDRRQRLAAWAMVAAFLPSLLYLGHWSVNIGIPGTDSFVAIGMNAEHEAQSGDGSHEEHCHGSTTCTNTRQAPSTAGVAMLSQALAFAVAAGAMFPVAAVDVRTLAQAGVAPLLPPPRGAAG